MKILILSLLAATAASAAETKDFQLFVGADIAVPYQGTLEPVVGVDRDAFIIEGVNGRHEVRMNASGRLKITPIMKLARTLATVNKLVVERAYTPGNDPDLKIFRENEAYSALDDDMALGDNYAAENPMPSNTALVKMRPEQAAYNTKVFKQYQETATIANGMNSAEAVAASVREGKVQDALQRENYDALHISFDVNSDHPLTAPYLVATASYRASNRKDEPAHSWIYAEDLQPIEARAHRVEVLAGGLPPGFTFERFRLHLYDRGAEVATTVSTNWTPMSQDEAFEYIVANYVGSHRDDSMPAAVVMRYPSRQECAAMIQAGAPNEIFVKVGKDGMPAGAFLDSGCTRPAPEGLISVTAGQLRFTPALDHGHRVEGVARINLSL